MTLESARILDCEPSWIGQWLKEAIYCTFEH